MFEAINRFTSNGAERIIITRKVLDILWVNTGSQCPYQCPQCHIQSSPTNTDLLFMDVQDISTYLDQYSLLPCSSGIRTIGFTGGEPFMNPHFLDILHRTLFHNADFHVLILTTATQTMTKKWKGLGPLLQMYGNRITIRVSIDHPTREKHIDNRRNSKYRGKEPAIWEPMIKGISLLARTPCTLGITGLPWIDETAQDLQAGYKKLCDKLKIAIPKKEIVIFPDRVKNFDQDGDNDLTPDGVTQGCLDLYDKTKDDFMCSDSIMLVKPNYANGKIGFAPCTIIPKNKNYCLFGYTLQKAMEEPLLLAHKNCVWCLSGGNCGGSCDT